MGLDPFLKKKFERVFYGFFDTNRNGVIDWNDFEILFGKIKELRGEDSHEYRIVSDAMLMVWKGLLQETKGIDMTQEIDREIEVTIDEWLKIWESFNPKHMPIWQWEYLKYMFFLIDTSGDKFIDEAEYVEVMAIYGMKPADSKAAFAKFAVSEGKKVDKVNYGQFVRLWYDFFGSTDKSKAGNYLFGKIE
jgi:Ca2+-binding EF-hand superfamily protein